MTVEAGIGADSVVGGDCSTDGGYADIRQGAQVTVTDESGTVVGVGSLAAGTTAEVSDALDMPLAMKCEFDFSVLEVPDGHPFYSVEVSHRGQLRYQRTALDKALELTLG